jgi:hypothetical protein
VYCRIKPGKSATSNDYPSRFHAIIANRNATREIEILLMAVIIQSFSHLFLKLAALEISLSFASTRLYNCCRRDRPLSTGAQRLQELSFAIASFFNLSSPTLGYNQIGIDRVHGFLKVEIREMWMGKSAASKRTPLTS